MGKWLWKCILAPVPGIFLIWFAFLWGTVWLGSASRLAQERLWGFSLTPCSAPGCVSRLCCEEVAASAHLALSKP